ncbi:MAG: hypothetical protein IJC39_02005 [Firmicutes bacterium]|nr:hypothetical protein [Bacillota bacterium]
MAPFITALLIIGIVLIIAELLIPGFGLPGISGIVLISCSFVLSSTMNRVLMLVIILAIIAAAVAVFIILLRKKRTPQGLVLHESLDAQAYDTSRIYHLMNRTGFVQTPLKPFGMVDFGGEVYECFSEIEYIPKGAKVKCIQIRGKNIIVRKISSDFGE